MPIYAYKCSTCNHEQDVLQKMSDPVLTDCPQCGESTYVKQVTAAGFQLKGSGWYVTDFRNNGSGKASGSEGGGNSSAGGDSSSSNTPSSTTATPATLHPPPLLEAAAIKRCIYFRSSVGSVH